MDYKKRKPGFYTFQEVIMNPKAVQWQAVRYI
jgi:hypothetical protein